MKTDTLTFALAGNPNSGKTSMFNAITGARQKVGNWSGVTVEKKEGSLTRNGIQLKIIDLPGIYSLTPFSIEEVVARNYLINKTPDVVINIIDSTNLERALYLATQIRELDCKVIFALNMADILMDNDIFIDDEKLSELLGLPVVFTIASKKQGIEELLDKAIALATSEQGYPGKRKVRYSSELEKSIYKIQDELRISSNNEEETSLRWKAVKLLEKDRLILESFKGTDIEDSMTALVLQERERLKGFYNDEPEMIMTDERYGFIEGIIREVLHTSSVNRIDVSRKIDNVLTNRFLGLPIFALFIWLMFQITFSLGQFPMDALDSCVSLISGLASAAMPQGILKSLVTEGIIPGVGSVLIFFPNILILFFCIALFEDTGYMARAAFLMDRVMHTIGLHGKSFIPMLMGFGCNVPAIMAARTLENEKDRILTILITPFMSCSARLPVFIILAGTFFPEKAGNIIFSLYLTGIAVAILSGKLLRTTILKGEEAPFVMELPPYRVPMLRSLMIHMWDRSKMFLKKMGGIILAGSIIIWALNYFPHQSTTNRYDKEIKSIQAQFETSTEKTELTKKLAELKAEKEQEHVRNSYLGRIGKAISPFFKPLGIDWKGSVSLVTGLFAKEIVVSTMGVLYGADSNKDASLKLALKNSGMTPLSAYSMMIFVLLYIPCLATIMAIKEETGSIQWALFSIFFTTSNAWLFSFVFFNGGTFLSKFLG